MSTALTTLTKTLANKLDMGDGGDLIETLKATAFKGPVSDAQMTALLVVANQYGLNPWTKEIYAFPDKNNGIVPVVGVDGWSRIINSHPQFDGLDFRMSENMLRMKEAKSDAPEWIECVMYRKDRSHPIIVREYLDETYREPFKGQYGTVLGPWQSHPKRFLRHKAMIQCARLAFGYTGIYDQDEAERIVESGATKNMGKVEIVDAQPALPAPYTDDEFSANLPKWQQIIAGGRKTADELVAFISSKRPLTEAQQQQLRAAQPVPKQAATADAQHDDAAVMTYAEVADALHKSGSLDELATAGSRIAYVQDRVQRDELTAIYEKLSGEMSF